MTVRDKGGVMVKSIPGVIFRHSGIHRKILCGCVKLMRCCFQSLVQLDDLAWTHYAGGGMPLLSWSLVAY